MLVLLLCSWAMPAIAALKPKSDSDLPACCRRNGKHHCMMSMAERSESANRAPAVSGPPEQCPYYPATIPGVLGNLFVASAREKNPLPHIEQCVASTQLPAILAVRAENAHLKRGPPLA